MMFLPLSSKILVINTSTEKFCLTKNWKNPNEGNPCIYLQSFVENPNLCQDKCIRAYESS